VTVEKQCKRSTGTITLNPEKKLKEVDIKMSQISA
jgi:hypothetical protein